MLGAMAVAGQLASLLAVLSPVISLSSLAMKALQMLAAVRCIWHHLPGNKALLGHGWSCRFSKRHDMPLAVHCFPSGYMDDLATGHAWHTWVDAVQEQAPVIHRGDLLQAMLAAQSPSDVFVQRLRDLWSCDAFAHHLHKVYLWSMPAVSPVFLNPHHDTGHSMTGIALKLAETT